MLRINDKISIPAVARTPLISSAGVGRLLDSGMRAQSDVADVSPLTSRACRKTARHHTHHGFYSPTLILSPHSLHTTPPSSPPPSLYLSIKSSVTLEVFYKRCGVSLSGFMLIVLSDYSRDYISDYSTITPEITSAITPATRE